MCRKNLTVVFIALCFLTAGAQATLADERKQQAPLVAQKAKKIVSRLGTGRKAKIKVTLRDGEKIKGFISSAGPDDFVVIRTDHRIGAGVIVPYTDVARLNETKISVEWRDVGMRTRVGALVLYSFIRTISLPLPPQPAR